MPLARTLHKGESTQWIACKRAVFYGTVAIVQYATDDGRYIMFGACHPRSGQSEIALNSHSKKFNNEDEAHSAYDDVKTHNYVINESEYEAHMSRTTDNVVAVEFVFKG